MKPLRPLLSLAAVLWAGSLLACQSSPTAAPDVPNSLPQLDGLGMGSGHFTPGTPIVTESGDAAPADSASNEHGLGMGSGH